MLPPEIYDLIFQNTDLDTKRILRLVCRLFYDLITGRYLLIRFPCSAENCRKLCKTEAGRKTHERRCKVIIQNKKDEERRIERLIGGRVRKRVKAELDRIEEEKRTRRRAIINQATDSDPALKAIFDYFDEKFEKIMCRLGGDYY